MKNIYVYEVRIIKSKLYENTFETKLVEVGLENENHIILIDPNFTKLDKRSDRSNINPVIDKQSISEWKLGCESLDGIHYTLYTYKTKKAETIRREIRAFIQDRYGYLFEVNLDFIK